MKKNVQAEAKRCLDHIRPALERQAASVDRTVALAALGELEGLILDGHTAASHAGPTPRKRKKKEPEAPPA